DLLEIPDDLVERKRNLLFGLEAHDVGDLLFFDRRELDEAGQTALAGDADHDRIAFEIIAREELFESLARQLIRVRVRLTENLRMFDVVEGGGGDLPVHVLQANGFQSALTQVNAPNAGSRCRHGLSPSSVSREIRRRPKGQVMGPEGWD